MRKLPDDLQRRGTGERRQDTDAAARLDRAFGAAGKGSPEGFAMWLSLVELPLRSSLRSFASLVDVEAVLQEGFLRMWVLAPTLRLQGRNASLRYATRLVFNLACSEARRLGRVTTVELESIRELAGDRLDVTSPPDPSLRRLIRLCLDQLPGQPRRALQARLEDGGLSPDRDIAAAIPMKTNTFLQNIVRARKLMVECLGKHGVAREDIRP